MPIGAQATAAIEGNTLSVEQVTGIYDGSFEGPPSRHYQELDVRNVLDALCGKTSASRCKAGRTRACRESSL